MNETKHWKRRVDKSDACRVIVGDGESLIHPPPARPPLPPLLWNRGEGERGGVGASPLAARRGARTIRRSEVRASSSASFSSSIHNAWSPACSPSFSLSCRPCVRHFRRRRRRPRNSPAHANASWPTLSPAQFACTWARIPPRLKRLQKALCRRNRKRRAPGAGNADGAAAYAWRGALPPAAAEGLPAQKSQPAPGEGALTKCSGQGAL